MYMHVYVCICMYECVCISMYLSSACICQGMHHDVYVFALALEASESLLLLCPARPSPQAHRAVHSSESLIKDCRRAAACPLPDQPECHARAAPGQALWRWDCHRDPRARPRPGLSQSPGRPGPAAGGPPPSQSRRFRGPDRVQDFKLWDPKPCCPMTVTCTELLSPCCAARRPAGLH